MALRTSTREHFWVGANGKWGNVGDFAVPGGLDGLLMQLLEFLGYRNVADGGREARVERRNGQLSTGWRPTNDTKAGLLGRQTALCHLQKI